MCSRSAGWSRCAVNVTLVPMIGDMLLAESVVHTGAAVGSPTVQVSDSVAALPRPFALTPSTA